MLGADAGLIDDRQADAARTALIGLGLRGRELLTYLANTLRVGDREVPYSLVTAIERVGADVPPFPEGAADVLRRGDEIGSGEPVLLFGFGGGLTYAGQVVLSP